MCMKKKRNISIAPLVVALCMALGCLSCESGDPEFPDFDYQTVYFASQYPVRTVELGNDPEWDLTDDNNHCVVVKATMGGSYGNKRNIVVNYVVDESLCNDLYFSEEGAAMTKILPLPTAYYTLEESQICIKKGELLGGVTVHLTDAFFADSLSLSNNYVLPLRMTSIVEGVDSILEDKDYVLYALKYINPWQAHYLRHGLDRVTQDGVTTTVARHYEYVEDDELVETTTLAYLENSLSITYKDADGRNYVVDLKLSFTEDGKCTVSSSTENVTASGTGEYVALGEKESFGGKDRDALYLNYSVDMPELGATYETVDTLVMQYRGVTSEYFTPVEQ